MRKILFIKILGFCILFMLSLTGCKRGGDTKTVIEIRHHYNGTQKIALDEMVAEFNETLGFEKGIVVEAFSQGNINELQKTILDAAYKKVGAKEIPNIVTAYPDTSHPLDELGLIVDLTQYIKKKEIEKYVDSYIEEGYLGQDQKLKILPIAKATEVMMINKTDWDKFVSATGAKIEDLESWEGLARTAALYYQWTDSLTDLTNDGKAFFGRDAMANYMLVGAKQLGQELFEVENNITRVKINKEIMRRLWDCYYVPYVKGYYGSYGRFSTDDIRTGEIIALVGSTAGASYFPDDVTIGEEAQYNIEPLILAVPSFENTKPHAIQQGAGMVVLKSDKAHEKASVEFLKWFTEAERNMTFCLETGYLPVAKEANIKDVFEEKLGQADERKISKQQQMALRVSIDQVKTYELYKAQVFENADEARDFLTHALTDQARKDRKIVLELINRGKSHEEAINYVLTNTSFEQWLLDFQENLGKIIR